jgi:rod shape-determining protein MreC
VVVIVVIVLSLLLIGLDRRLGLGPLRDLGGSLLAPLQTALHDAGIGIGGLFDVFGETRELRRENERLRRIIESLTAENARVQSLRAENERLRQQLGFREARAELQQLPAEVVARDPTSLRKFIVIDRGRRDGIEPGMAVVSPAGLVGRIQTVDERRARVLLVIDSLSAVRAIIQENRTDEKPAGRADGIVYGRWPLGRLRMRYIDTTAQVQEGNWVLTSGLDDELPKDLPIGIVQKVYKTDVQETQEVDIAPLVDPDALESVTVILRSK